MVSSRRGPALQPVQITNTYISVNHENYSKYHKKPKAQNLSCAFGSVTAVALRGCANVKPVLGLSKYSHETAFS
jgi:hypothetical protein